MFTTFRLLLSASLAALFFGAATLALAAETYEQEIETVEVSGAPYTVEVQQAQWVEQEDGSYALEVQYEVENQSSESLAAIGVTFAIETEDGNPKSHSTRTATSFLEAGKRAAYQLSISEKSLGGFDPTDRISMAGNSSSHRRCPGANCQQAHFACQQKCSNPLGTNSGIRHFRCGNCSDYYDQQRQCWTRSCEFECECNELLWPDQMPAIDELFDWDPVLDEAPPGEPLPF